MKSYKEMYPLNDFLKKPALMAEKEKLHHVPCQNEGYRAGTSFATRAAQTRRAVRRWHQQRRGLDRPRSDDATDAIRWRRWMNARRVRQRLELDRHADVLHQYARHEESCRLAWFQ